MLSRMILMLTLLLSITSAWAANSLTIAAAANLVYCINDLNKAFNQQYPKVRVTVTTGASGNFFAQIQQNAPYELFLSADTLYPQQLVDRQLADSKSLKVYTLGQVVLWSNKPDIKVSQGLDILKSTEIKRIAIANPDTAPYGMAAKLALQNNGLWDSVQRKLVFAESIAQTMQFVQTQNAEVGIVALSLLKAPQLQQQGHYWLIPQEDYPPLKQAMVVTKQGQKNEWAYRYAAFLQSAKAREIFSQYGFLQP